MWVSPLPNIQVHSMLTIKILEDKDWCIFRTLRLEALLDHPEAFGSSYDEEAKFSMEAFKDNYKKCDIFGAFLNEQLVGCAGFFVHSFTKMGHRGFLFAMYIRPDHRGFGIADTLVKAIIKHARKKVIQIHLGVVTTNKIAVRLYEENGFRIYGTEPRAIKVKDAYYDEHWMVLKFE